MTIKKVTVEDLRKISGGSAAKRKGRGNVKRGEKIAVKEIGKDVSKTIAAKNDDKKTPIKGPTPTTTKLP
jgi:hypothetical protein